MTLYHKILPFPVSCTWYQVCKTVSLWSEKMYCSESILQLTLRTNTVTSVWCPWPSILTGLENFQGLSLTLNPSPASQYLYFFVLLVYYMFKWNGIDISLSTWGNINFSSLPLGACSRHPGFLLSSWCLVTRQILILWLQLSWNLTISLLLEDK